MMRGFRQVATTNRRQFLQAGAAGGAALVVGFNWTAGRMKTAAAQAAGTFAPNAFVRIDQDGRESDHVAVPGRRAVACVLGGRERRTLYCLSADTSYARLAKRDSSARIDTSPNGAKH